jgi:putative ABC transport system ATP-binding protein
MSFDSAAHVNFAMMTEPDIIFKLSGLRRTYTVGSEQVHALDGVDLTIQDREFIAVVGTSGSGKSTLMHVLGFMDSPTDGRMEFESKDVTGINGADRADLRASRIGFVFQSFNLLPRLSVVDNVLLPLTYSRSPVSNKRELGMAALERVGMAHRSSHTPNQLSGGERQRVAIARALINQPRLILADEPTGNLDTKNRGLIMELFASLLEEGITLAIVTHDEEVAAYANRRIRMEDGRVVEDSKS